MVPGDIWTCDWTTEDTFVTNKYETPELVGYPTDSSSSEYTQDPFSNVIDSSYVIDNFSESTTEAVTAYPLIEFEESDVTTRADKDAKNVTYHKKENYLYEYYMNKQASLSLIEEYKNIIDNHYKCLNELINQLHNYKKLSAISSALSIPIRDITTVKPTKTIAIFESHNQEHNITLNYLVQSYTEENVKLHEDEPTEKEGNGSQINDSTSTPNNVVSTESTLQLLINSLDPENNIIRISDNLGNKRYLTINRYKNIASQLISRYISVVACTKNVRLPNRTDCNRYYMCDPKTASVLEFSCPLHTAFNVNSRICDIESAKTCGNNKLPINEIFVERHENITTDSDKKLMEEDQLCQELGKMKDSASDFHYYICYSIPGSEDIKSIRMSCPNALIFCQGKKVCTTRRLCRDDDDE